MVDISQSEEGEICERLRVGCKGGSGGVIGRGVVGFGSGGGDMWCALRERVLGARTWCGYGEFGWYSKGVVSIIE